MFNAKAYSATSATSPLASTLIARRDPSENDVQIEILFCGICHSDLHMARNEWSGVLPTVYPCVPGHEIVGRVTKVGSAVTKFKAGDLAGVGCLVDSDGTCDACKAGLEQFTDACARDPDVVALRSKVEVLRDNSLSTIAAAVDITTADGRIHQLTQPAARGSDANPLDDSDLEAKLRSAAAGWDPGHDATPLIEAIWTLDRSADVSQLASLAVPG